jgi:predicted class III extradiol MEMO1 family dioxygenase
MNVRSPAVAGSFYPREASSLAAQVAGYLRDARAKPGLRPKAIIAPHAGYIYSGPIAATAYALLAELRGTVTRVVPRGAGAPRLRDRRRGSDRRAHSRRRSGAFPSIAKPSRGSSRFLSSRRATTRTRSSTRSKVHLPFLQTVLGEFSVVPIVVGDAPPGQMADLFEAPWGGDETLIVVSSDLSHYLPYEAAATARPRYTWKRSSRSSAHRPGGACGAMPINGLLTLARRRGMAVELLDLRNSGDTGRRSRPCRRLRLVRVMREMTPTGRPRRNAARDRARRDSRDARRGSPRGLDRARGCASQPATFVTLRLEGSCAVASDDRSGAHAGRGRVRQCARRRVSRSRAFPPVSRTELGALAVEVSVLSPRTPMAVATEDEALAQLRPGIDGIVLEYDGQRATFLPQVWETLPDPREFPVAAADEGGSPGALLASAASALALYRGEVRVTAREPIEGSNYPGRWWHRLDDGASSATLCPRDLPACTRATRRVLSCARACQRRDGAHDVWPAPRAFARTRSRRSRSTTSSRVPRRFSFGTAGCNLNCSYCPK